MTDFQMWFVLIGVLTGVVAAMIIIAKME